MNWTWTTVVVFSLWGSFCSLSGYFLGRRERKPKTRGFYDRDGNFSRYR